MTPAHYPERIGIRSASSAKALTGRRAPSPFPLQMRPPFDLIGLADPPNLMNQHEFRFGAFSAKRLRSLARGGFSRIHTRALNHPSSANFILAAMTSAPRRTGSSAKCA